jgi:hypothetical protein
MAGDWRLTTCDLRLTTTEGLAAGGDPKVGRPGNSEGGSVGWLTAQRKDLPPADGRAFLIRGKIVTSSSSYNAALAYQGFDGRRMLDTHERAITGPKQKLRFHEGAEQRITRGRVESPQPARLRFRESQSRHLEELSLDAPEHFICRALLGRHWHLQRVARDTLLGATDVPADICERGGKRALAACENRRDPRPHQRALELGKAAQAHPLFKA